MSGKTKAKPKSWVMPDWMKPYRKALESYHGGSTVEELMNDNDTNIQNNAIRACFCVSMKTNVAVLAMLKEQGLLKGGT